MTPRITVLLPVYNALPHLKYAVESLRSQTLPDFKVLVFDDGSSDGSGVYLDSINDDRFQIVHQENVGLAATLNRMLPLVETDYIARMDSDDISLPERLESQLSFMDDHPDVAVAGTRGGYILGRKSAASFGIGSKRLTLSYAPSCSEPPYWDPFKDGKILIHSTVIMRTEALRSVGGYPEIVPGQDLALWHRMAHAGFKLANMEELLLLSRVCRGGISSANLAKQYQTWRFIQHRSECLLAGTEPLCWEDYRDSHPMTPDDLSRLGARAQLRNALADLLACRWISGSMALARVLVRNPKLVFERIRSRT